jgi:hypothetical protein
MQTFGRCGLNSQDALCNRGVEFYAAQGNHTLGQSMLRFSRGRLAVSNQMRNLAA